MLEVRKVWPAERPKDFYKLLSLVADRCPNGVLSLDIQIALCVNWLDLRQTLVSQLSRDRLSAAMWATTIYDAAEVFAGMLRRNKGAVEAFARLRKMYCHGPTIITKKPTLQDLPRDINSDEMGALVIWKAEDLEAFPMAAYIADDLLTIYTVESGEYEPIPLKDINTLQDAIRGHPSPLVEYHLVRMKYDARIRPQRGRSVPRDEVFAAMNLLEAEAARARKGVQSGEEASRQTPPPIPNIEPREDVDLS